MLGSFFDTNVILYLASNDLVKANRAEAILASGGQISVQVLNEVANVCRRKMRLPWDEVHAFLAMIRALVMTVPLTIEMHETGLRISQRYGLSLYDSMIVAAALAQGCDTLWSEDMSHDLLIDATLRIRNPFRPD